MPARSKANLLTLGCAEGKCSIYYRVPVKESRQLVLKRPEFPDGFQGKVFNQGEGGVCGAHDQLVNIFLIGWWCGKWESASSTFWF